MEGRREWGQLSKTAIRAKMAGLRRQVTPAEKGKWDGQICERVLAYAGYRQARQILVYLSTREEVATDRIIAHALSQGKRVAAPRTLREKECIEAWTLSGLADVVPGEWGIREPRKMGQDGSARAAIPCAEFDLILVPGLAFTMAGDRLGYGGGFYDRYLQTCPVCVCRVGLSYDLQLCSTLPVEDFDQKLDAIITPSATFTCRQEFHSN